MPVYAYQCKSCDHAFDIRQSFTDDALTNCPDCHQPALRKRFGTVGITFKGSGFYRTESRSESSSSGGSSGSQTSEGSGGSHGSSGQQAGGGSASSDGSSSRGSASHRSASRSDAQNAAAGSVRT